MQSLMEAAAALRDGKTTSRELVEACLDKIADPAGEGGRCFITVYAAQSRAGADAMDTLRRANRAPGDFAGIPISVKDLFDIEGEVTRAGSTVLADAAASGRTATVVLRLLSAGLIPVGRSNMTEFAFSGVGINPHYGTPRSPWDRATGRIPGGSSSGAAVSVTDGFAFAGIGTDTGGSCRIPAALCGIVGFKPTARRVPLDGVLPLAPSLDSVGPLARTVACCAALDAIMAAEGKGTTEARDVTGLRLLIPTNFAFDHLDSATEAAFDRAVARLDAAGALIDRRPLGAFTAMNEAHAKGGFAAVEAFAWHRDKLAQWRAQYDPFVASRIETGAAMAAADYVLLAHARRRIIGQFAAEMAPYDALIVPTVPMKPPALSAFADMDDYKRLNFLLLRTPSAINFFDGCGISVPCHAPDAPPSGLMLAAPSMRDRRLLAVAAAVEGYLQA